jgi:cytochrome c oxidase assembly protein subunit 11
MDTGRRSSLLDAGTRAAHSARRNHLLRLSAVAGAMFAFGFAFVPMYRVFCQLTGVNLNAAEMQARGVAPVTVDATRWVNVQFTTTVNGGADWSFHPQVSTVRVHPGELTTVSFHAQNPEGRALVAQAVPSITPLEASRHLRKTDCFCFRKQEFKPHEARDMAVRFMVDPELPADVDTVTLSYTFFDITELARRESGGPS